VKFQLLPSTIDDNGLASARQHLACFVVDDRVAFDAGSLAMSCSAKQRTDVRDVVLTHAHLDHIVGLPLFIDDLYSTLTEPIIVHATEEVIKVLERDIFNWSVYPRFSELSNAFGQVMTYRPFTLDVEFPIRHLRVKAAAVNHLVPSSGFVITDNKTRVAMSGDTSAMEVFWNVVNDEPALSVLLIECALPNELQNLAELSHHLTPNTFAAELKKFKRSDCPVFVINIKPTYRDDVIAQINELGLERVSIMEIGRVYDW
jgi:cAMP phosphodiesterase